MLARNKNDSTGVSRFPLLSVNARVLSFILKRNRNKITIHIHHVPVRGQLVKSHCCGTLPSTETRITAKPFIWDFMCFVYEHSPVQAIICFIIRPV